MRAFSFLLIALTMSGIGAPAPARPLLDLPSARPPAPQVIFVSRSSKVVRSVACSTSPAKGKRKKSGYCARAKPVS